MSRRSKLPVIEERGISARIIAGSLYGATSPVKTHSELFYADVQMTAGTALPLPVDHEERGVYVAEGEIEVAGQVLRGRPPAGVPPGRRHHAPCHGAMPALMLLGGEPMDGPRYIWWNFVSSSKDRIEAAKDDWKQARFAIVPGDEKDFIPLPEK